MDSLLKKGSNGNFTAYQGLLKEIEKKLGESFIYETGYAFFNPLLHVLIDKSKALLTKCVMYICLNKTLLYSY